MDQTFEKRKKIIYEFICDDLYVPMKLKELAILLQVPKEQKDELKKVMDALEAEGKVHLSSKNLLPCGSHRFFQHDIKVVRPSAVYERKSSLLVGGRSHQNITKGAVGDGDHGRISQHVFINIFCN